MVFSSLVHRRHTGARRLLQAGALPLTAAAACAGALVAVPAGTAARGVAASPPKTVRASALPAPTRGPNRPGTAIASSKLGIRVFVSSKHGFALATPMYGGEATYPAATVDGGKTWRVAGPVFHIPAANAPDVVTEVGAAAPATYFAYGGPGGGGAVDVSSDAGKHWYRAQFGAVYAVVARSHTSLLAFTAAPGVYHSTDGGRTWHYSTSPAGIL
jgi:hypothetical protein